MTDARDRATDKTTRTTHRSRRARRVAYGRALRIRMEDGSLLSGTAGDFSSTGFFLDMATTRTNKDLVGRRGVLLVSLPAESLELPCQVVRITQKGLGMRFLP